MHERKDSSGQEIQQSRVQRSEQTVCIKYIKEVEVNVDIKVIYLLVHSVMSAD